MKVKVQSRAYSRRRGWPRACAWGLALACAMSGAFAQDCQTSSDLDDATRAAITTAGRHYFDLAAKGDTASLRQNAVATVASDFSTIEATVKDHQPDLAGAQASVKSAFLLEAAGSAPVPRVEFYCGLFGTSGQTAGSAVFVLNDLPPGKYAIVIFDVAAAKTKANFSLVLQQAGADWKLAGLYMKPVQIAGHDSEWFAARAREYKAKGQLHNAWFFYLQARSLISPLPSMSTQATDKLYDESQGAQPADVPANGKTVDLAAGGATYKLAALFPEGVGDDLDLVARFQVADASNSNQAYQINIAVIKALVAKYPEIKEAFAAIEARAVDASGHDFGTLLAMKEIK
jgi:hypothetical protein